MRSNPSEAEGPEARSNDAHQGGTIAKKRKPALNSSSLWHKSKGVTSDEVYDIVQDHRAKKDAQLQAKMAKTAERQRKRTKAACDANELGSRVWNELIDPDCERPNSYREAVRARFASRFAQPPSRNMPANLL